MIKKILFALMTFLIIFTATSLQAKSKTINVTVDPRIELLAAVQLFSGYESQTGLITDYDIDYKWEMTEHFSDYIDHPAIQAFQNLSENGFSFDAPAAAMLYLSNPPELEIVKPFSDYLTGRAKGEENLVKFISDLRDFARNTDFMAFYNSHEDTYDKIIDDVQGKLSSENYVATLEDYYGMNQHSYNIILAPLFHHGGFGPRLELADGTYDVHNICGPTGNDEGLPIFGTAEEFKYLAWHEFSHSFVNPTTAQFITDISNYESLFTPISERMSSQAYPSWETCVNEHIVRAVTTRLAHLNDGRKAGERAIVAEQAKGFFYVPALCEKLEIFEKQKDRYPTFVDFYPELITAFKSLAESDLDDEFFTVPFIGSINSVVGDKKSVILITPTHESDPEMQTSIHGFIEQIRNRFYPDAEILADDEALERDLSSYSIVVYGTPQGNSWLAENIRQLPVKIRDNSIVADKVYDGTDLKFITAWPNPFNPKKGMVVYTAQRAADIVGINNIFHGPTDYVIGQGHEVLNSADYNKDDDRWRF
jgi:Domain of unknown function (DUF4932)